MQAVGKLHEYRIQINEIINDKESLCYVKNQV